MDNDLQYEILKSTGMHEKDIYRHIKNGVYIYRVTEILGNFDKYYFKEVFTEHEIETLINFLKAAQNKSRLWDNEITYCNGTAYYIEYLL